MNIKPIICFIVFSSLLSGCTVLKTGDLIAQSHFIHPGSTVKVLGVVKDEVSDWGFIFPPDFDYAEAMILYENALNQQPGADMLVDYTLDTTFKWYPTPLLGLPLYTMEIVIQGNAADVKVGKEY